MLADARGRQVRRDMTGDALGVDRVVERGVLDLREGIDREQLVRRRRGEPIAPVDRQCEADGRVRDEHARCRSCCHRRPRACCWYAGDLRDQRRLELGAVPVDLAKDPHKRAFVGDLAGDRDPHEVVGPRVTHDQRAKPREILDVAGCDPPGLISSGASAGASWIAASARSSSITPGSSGRADRIEQVAEAMSTACTVPAIVWIGCTISRSRPSTPEGHGPTVERSHTSNRSDVIWNCSNEKLLPSLGPMSARPMMKL